MVLFKSAFITLSLAIDQLALMSSDARCFIAAWPCPAPLLLMHALLIESFPRLIPGFHLIYGLSCQFILSSRRRVVFIHPISTGDSHA